MLQGFTSRLWQQLAISTNWPALVAVAMLCATGTITIWAHAAAVEQAGVIRSSGDVRKHLMFIGIGVTCMFAIQAVSYQRIGRLAWVFYGMSLLLLLYTVLPGTPRSGLLGVPEINGARRWINFGFLNLQAAELAKVAFIMVLARYLRFRSNYRTLKGLLPPFALAVLPLLLILRQPDLGSGLVFIPALFAILFVAGAKMKHLLGILLLGLMLSPLAWFSGPKEQTGLGFDVPVLRSMPVLVRGYQRARINAMFSSDPAVLRETGFQQQQALIAFGAGSITGRGFGAVPVSVQVPEAHNDMILAPIGEQFGFVGVLVILGAYLVICAAGVEIASATREPFGRLLAIGIVALLAGQAILNLMVAVRIMPVTGLTLPFVSYGGSSMLTCFIALGLLLNVGQNRPIVMARDSFEY